MFGSIPADVTKVSISEFRRMRAYYRFVSGYAAGSQEGVTVEQTGLKIEEGANIIE